MLDCRGLALKNVIRRIYLLNLSNEGLTIINLREYLDAINCSPACTAELGAKSPPLPLFFETERQ